MRITGIYSTGDTTIGRSLLGFAVAPLTATLCVILAYASFVAPRLGGTPYDQLLNLLGAVLFCTTFGSFIAYIGMLLIGVPTWLVLRFTGNESALAYTLCGATGGWLLATILASKLSADPIRTLGVAVGALSLFLFWRIARRRH